MKKLIQIILLVGIVILAYLLFEQIMTPLRFQKEKDMREAAVIERLKDIRLAEKAFKVKHSRYTGDFDSLINFLLTDSIAVKKTIGSADDSVAVAKGLVKTETFYVHAIDTVFSPKKLTVEDIKNLIYIPYSNEAKFILAAGNFTTESKVVVPVFECKAPYKDFLSDLDRQELINLNDERVTLKKYKGLKVGALDQATNDAGNWE